jgi:hypothetical protein
MEDRLISVDTLKRTARRAFAVAHRRLGTAGMAGLALLSLSVAGFAWSPWMSAEAERMQGAVDRTRARLIEIDRELAAEPGSLQYLERFRAWLPPLANSRTDLRTLFRVADETRITLPRGDYSIKRNATRGVAQVDVVLPVEGTYPDIRAFVAAALDALPNASLADLRMERAASNVDRLDVRLRLTLFYRES